MVRGTRDQTTKRPDDPGGDYRAGGAGGVVAVGAGAPALGGAPAAFFELWYICVSRSSAMCPTSIVTFVIRFRKKALKKIAEAQTPFASRADDSGTHKAELKLWHEAGVDPKTSSGSWYLETGSGMGATLNIAVGKQAYALTDRGTWLAFANKGDFKVMVEGDNKLFNQYGVILVNPAKHPNVKAKQGQAFIDWLTGPEGQAAIANYKIDGQQLFFPNARPQS